MASGKPVIHQAAWLSLIPQAALLAVLTLLFGIFIQPPARALQAAILVYFAAFLLLRNLVPRNHRKGMRLFKAGSYAQAIEEYQKSYDFFTKHAWVDKYRYITLMSSSRMSYREMALLNIAYCHAQLGNGAKAIACYEAVLREFPDSQMAQSALQMLRSVFDNGSNQ
ncbi:MAG: tetratricopeptide repeat protein [Roseburia sp.]|nr:tetratricopeptide repeat protein [Roseburia sp.]